MRDESTLPPEILLLGTKQSHEVKCFPLGQAERSSPHSAMSLSEVGSEAVDLSEIFAE